MYNETLKRVVSSKIGIISMNEKKVLVELELN